MSLKLRSYSNSHSYKQPNHSTDTAILSTMVLDDLFQQGEWREVKDIVQIGFKALTEAVKAQAEQMKELKTMVCQKVGKNELAFQLNNKQNFNNSQIELESTLKQIQKVQGEIDDKVGLKDIPEILREFVTHQELKYQLSSKISIEEARALINPKLSQEHSRQDFSLLRGRVEDLQRDMTTSVTRKELEAVLDQLEMKADKIELESKANKVSVISALHLKANKSELREIMKRDDYVEEILKILKEKADKREVQEQLNKREQDIQSIQFDIQQLRTDVGAIKKEVDKSKLREKESYEQFKKSIESSLERTSCQVIEKAQEIAKNEVSEVAGAIYKLEQELVQQQNIIASNLSERESIFKQISDEIGEFGEQQKHYQINSKIQNEENCKQLNMLGTQIYEIKKIQEENEQDQIKQLDSYMILTKQEIYSALKEKVNLREVQQALNVCQQDFVSRIQEYQQEVKIQIDEISNDLRQALLKNKLNFSNQISDQNNTLQQKAINKEIDLLSSNQDRLQSDLSSKLSILVFEKHVQQIKLALDAIQKDMVLKTNNQEILPLLLSKVDVEDFNKTLSQLYKELNQKSTQDDLNNIVNDQAVINESLCTENIVGRWTWKSQNLKQGKLIPWESQATNTLPDNYVWEKDKSHILCVTPGLYQIDFGFFTAKRPLIKLLVNGELTLSTENLPCASKFEDFGGHSDGNISGIDFIYLIESLNNFLFLTGLTSTDFLVLPENSRISLIYEGECLAEGFLGLRRL